MKKGLISIVLCLAVVFSFVALPVHAETSGKCGDNLTWTLDGSGLLTISGTGPMYNYSYDSSPWCWDGNIKSIKISEGVTSIGDYAFFGCYSLTSITIPNSVTRIGNGAFADSCIINITIPNSVTSIGDSAFDLCPLTSITIPNSVTSIGKSAFSNCYSLTSITIPNSVTSIGQSAFSECLALKSITIPNSVTSIAKGAFNRCSSLTSLTIPNSVTSIGQSAFSECLALKSITIPDSVTSIGDKAFAECSNLESVIISQNVKCIQNYTFNECSELISVTIPKSVTSIGEDAFKGCTILKQVDYSGSKEDWNKIDIKNGNGALKTANIVYNAKIEDNMAVQISDTDAYKTQALGGIRFINEIENPSSTDVEYYGTWIIPQDLFFTNLTDLKAEVKASGNLFGNKYTSDLVNVPKQYFDTPFVAISFVKFHGIKNLVLGTKVTSVNESYKGE